MANPFPGMNPYLETPAYWPGVHAALIYCLNVALNRALPSGFSARMNERIYVADWGIGFGPDVTVLRRPSVPDAGVAVLESPPTVESGSLPHILRVPSAEARETFIEVITRHSGEVIAVVEVLSPANKENGRGREEYLRKQRDLLESHAHLLEIDLLRAGHYTLAPPEVAMRREYGAWSYAACLHRAGNWGEFEVWPLQLRDPLPVLRVPLTEFLPDVNVALQAAFDRAHEENALDFGVDYNAEAVPPLTGADAAWADGLLRQAGLRSGAS